MKLSHIQEARYHRSPVIDWVNETVEKLETEIKLYFDSNGTGREEIGMHYDRRGISPEVIYNDLDGAFETAGEEGDTEDEHYWHIKTVPHPDPNRHNKIHINVVLDENNKLLVVYWV